MTQVFDWRRPSWCHAWHPDTDRGWHDVLINDGNQVWSLREVTRVTSLCQDIWHHSPRPRPGHSANVTEPELAITWSLGNLHFISLTSVCFSGGCSAVKITRYQRKKVPCYLHKSNTCKKHFGEQFCVKCSQRRAAGPDPSWPDSSKILQSQAPPARERASARWFATNYNIAILPWHRRPGCWPVKVADGEQRYGLTDIIRPGLLVEHFGIGMGEWDQAS